MIYQSCNVSRGDKDEYYTSIDINIQDNKSETLYAQKVFALDTEITIVPKSILNVLKRYNKDLIEMISTKYPEDELRGDLIDFSKLMEVIKDE